MLLGLALTVAPGAARAAGEAGSVWGADYFPNVELVSHEGNSLRFFDEMIEDRVVMINFIFTRCPDVCPLETARLREVQKILGDRVGRDVFMYSLTIDPEYDSVEVLRDYAEKFDIGPGWLFLTGKEADITLLRRKLGLYSDQDPNEELSSHTVSLAIGNQSTGQWMKSSPFENPYVLATQVGSWLHNWKLPPREEQDYAQAPPLRSISKGESLFRTRCASCHTIGAEAGGTGGRRPIGPDLAGVTEARDREWLVRWITAPDKMLEDRDPQAMELLAAYGDVLMPNLSLSRVEVEELLAYIEEASGDQKHTHDHGAHEHH